ncbi:MAG: MMPL family transporter [Gemmatimonadetes bacterium]|nr:MMPL family transporter [Gemmatimonadota bacterium]
MIALPARAIIRFRYLVMAFWLAVAAFAIPRARGVHDVLQVQGRSIQINESDRAETIIRERFRQPFSHFLAVTVRGPISVDSTPYRQVLHTLTRVARERPYIGTVLSHLTTDDPLLVSADRHATFFVAVIEDAHADSATNLVSDFRATIHRAAGRLPASEDYQIAVTGGPALDFDTRMVSKEDAALGERRALPLVAIVLVIAFGALVAALLPIVVGMFAITCTLALVHVAANFYPMSIFVLNIVTMIGLGVGIDYSLLMVTRFREELNRGLRRRDAAIRTLQTAGRAVVTSGLTVIAGFAGLFIIPLMETRSVAIGGVIVVSVAVLLSVTLLPVALAVLGRAIDMPRGLARKLAWYHAPTAWERWARWLGSHPFRALAIGLVAAGAITWPIAHIKIGLPHSGWFPAGTESTLGIEALDEIGARGALLPVRVVVAAPDGEKIVGSRYLLGLRRLSDTLKADPRVAQVRSAVDLGRRMSILQYSLLYSNVERARQRYPDLLATYLSEDASITRMDILLADSTSLTGSMDVVRRIRAIRDHGIRGLDSVSILVGGFQAASVDLQSNLLRRFPLLITVVLIITAVALFVAFQSVLVPLKAIVMNILPVAGAFGLIVLVFQFGIGVSLFGLDGPTEAIYVVVPVVVFAVVFGLSMDYEVFLLARIKEAFDRSGRNSQATMEGLSATASVITSAAAIMIIVFGTFSFSRVLAVQLTGFGLAVAVFLDATLIRMVMVPAFMHIAGRWNWWPGVRLRERSPAEKPPG